jgi:hypothetical protein
VPSPAAEAPPPVAVSRPASDTSSSSGIWTGEAFYVPTGEPGRFRATRHTIGPWSNDTQHAGPPSALLTRTIEQLPTSIFGSAQITRLSVDILGPVPVGEVEVSAAVTRPGSAVELIDAELSSGGRTAMRARAWRIRTTPVNLPAHVLEHAGRPPRMPSATEVHHHPREASWTGTYLGAVEWRFLTGHFEEPGPGAVWCRLRVGVVAGEEPSPTQRLMAIADSGNGLGSLLDFHSWWFINTDLTVHLHRLPAGEWIHLAATSHLDPSGIGLAESDLYDATGRVGRGAQSLLVGPR